MAFQQVSPCYLSCSSLGEYHEPCCPQPALEPDLAYQSDSGRDSRDLCSVLILYSKVSDLKGSVSASQAQALLPIKSVRHKIAADNNQESEQRDQVDCTCITDKDRQKHVVIMH